MLPRRVKGLGALSFIGLIGLAVLVDFSFSFFLFFKLLGMCVIVID